MELMCRDNYVIFNLLKGQIEKNNSCYYIRDHGLQRNVSSSSL